MNEIETQRKRERERDNKAESTLLCNMEKHPSRRMVLVAPIVS